MKLPTIRVYERKGIWWAAWTANKRTVRRSLGVTSELEALSIVDGWSAIPARVHITDTTLGLVYFIEAIGLSRVKIGWTRTNGLKSRLSALQTFSPVELRVLGTYPGFMTTERAEHRRWAHLRSHGEWFELTNELIEHIRCLPKAAKP